MQSVETLIRHLHHVRPRSVRGCSDADLGNLVDGLETLCTAVACHDTTPASSSSTSGRDAAGGLRTATAIACVKELNFFVACCFNQQNPQPLQWAAPRRHAAVLSVRALHLVIDRASGFDASVMDEVSEDVELNARDALRSGIAELVEEGAKLTAVQLVRTWGSEYTVDDIGSLLQDIADACPASGALVASPTMYEACFALAALAVGVAQPLHPLALQRILVPWVISLLAQLVVLGEVAAAADNGSLSSGSFSSSPSFAASAAAAASASSSSAANLLSVSESTVIAAGGSAALRWSTVEAMLSLLHTLHHVASRVSGDRSTDLAELMVPIPALLTSLTVRWATIPPASPAQRMMQQSSGAGGNALLGGGGGGGGGGSIGNDHHQQAQQQYQMRGNTFLCALSVFAGSLQGCLRKSTCDALMDAEFVHWFECGLLMDTEAVPTSVNTTPASSPQRAAAAAAAAAAGAGAGAPLSFGEVSLSDFTAGASLASNTSFTAPPSLQAAAAAAAPGSAGRPTSPDQAHQQQQQAVVGAASFAGRSSDISIYASALDDPFSNSSSHTRRVASMGEPTDGPPPLKTSLLYLLYQALPQLVERSTVLFHLVPMRQYFIRNVGYPRDMLLGKTLSTELESQICSGMDRFSMSVRNDPCVVDLRLMRVAGYGFEQYGHATWTPLRYKLCPVRYAVTVDRSALDEADPSGHHANNHSAAAAAMLGAPILRAGPEEPGGANSMARRLEVAARKAQRVEIESDEQYQLGVLQLASTYFPIMLRFYPACRSDVQRTMITSCIAQILKSKVRGSDFVLPVLETVHDDLIAFFAASFALVENLLSIDRLLMGCEGFCEFFPSSVSVMVQHGVADQIFALSRRLIEKLEQVRGQANSILESTSGAVGGAAVVVGGAGASRGRTLSPTAARSRAVSTAAILQCEGVLDRAYQCLIRLRQSNPDPNEGRVGTPGAGAAASSSAAAAVAGQGMDGGLPQQPHRQVVVDLRARVDVIRRINQNNMADDAQCESAVLDLFRLLASREATTLTYMELASSGIVSALVAFIVPASPSPIPAAAATNSSSTAAAATGDCTGDGGTAAATCAATATASTTPQMSSIRAKETVSARALRTRRRVDMFINSYALTHSTAQQIMLRNCADQQQQQQQLNNSLATPRKTPSSSSSASSSALSPLTMPFGGGLGRGGFVFVPFLAQEIDTYARSVRDRVPLVRRVINDVRSESSGGGANGNGGGGADNENIHRQDSGGVLFGAEEADGAASSEPTAVEGHCRSLRGTMEAASGSGACFAGLALKPSRVPSAAGMSAAIVVEQTEEDDDASIRKGRNGGRNNNNSSSNNRSRRGRRQRGGGGGGRGWREEGDDEGNQQRAPAATATAATMLRYSRRSSTSNASSSYDDDGNDQDRSRYNSEERFYENDEEGDEEEEEEVVVEEEEEEEQGNQHVLFSAASADEEAEDASEQDPPHMSRPDKFLTMHWLAPIGGCVNLLEASKYDLRSQLHGRAATDPIGSVLSYMSSSREASALCQLCLARAQHWSSLEHQAIERNRGAAAAAVATAGTAVISPASSAAFATTVSSPNSNNFDRSSQQDPLLDSMPQQRRTPAAAAASSSSCALPFRFSAPVYIEHNSPGRLYQNNNEDEDFVLFPSNTAAATASSATASLHRRDATSAAAPTGARRSAAAASSSSSPAANNNSSSSSNSSALHLKPQRTRVYRFESAHTAAIRAGFAPRRFSDELLFREAEVGATGVENATLQLTLDREFLTVPEARPLRTIDSYEQPQGSQDLSRVSSVGAAVAAAAANAFNGTSPPSDAASPLASPAVALMRLLHNNDLISTSAPSGVTSYSTVATAAAAQKRRRGENGADSPASMAMISNTPVSYASAVVMAMPPSDTLDELALRSAASCALSVAQCSTLSSLPLWLSDTLLYTPILISAAARRRLGKFFLVGARRAFVAGLLSNRLSSDRVLYDVLPADAADVTSSLQHHHSLRVVRRVARWPEESPEMVSAASSSTFFSLSAPSTVAARQQQPAAASGGASSAASSGSGATTRATKTLDELLQEEEQKAICESKQSITAGSSSGGGLSGSATVGAGGGGAGGLRSTRYNNYAWLECECACDAAIMQSAGDPTVASFAFEGDVGTGTGPSMQIFASLARSLAEHQTDRMWRKTSAGLLFPHPVRRDDAITMGRLRLVGAAMARAWCDDRVLPLPLDPAVFEAIQGRIVSSMHHTRRTPFTTTANALLESFDPDMGRVIAALQTLSDSVVDVCHAALGPSSRGGGSASLSSTLLEYYTSEEIRAALEAKMETEAEGGPTRELVKQLSQYALANCVPGADHVPVIGMDLDMEIEPHDMPRYTSVMAELLTGLPLAPAGVSAAATGAGSRRRALSLSGVGASVAATASGVFPGAVGVGGGSPASCLSTSAVVPGTHLILDGFCEVAPAWPLLLLNSHDLCADICGNHSAAANAEWTAAQVTAVLMADHGYAASSPQVHWLAEATAALSADKRLRRQFLTFVTGCPVLPAGGLSAIGPVRVVRKEGSSTGGPSSAALSAAGLTTPPRSSTRPASALSSPRIGPSRPAVVSAAAPSTPPAASTSKPPVHQQPQQYRDVRKMLDDDDDDLNILAPAAAKRNNKSNEQQQQQTATPVRRPINLDDDDDDDLPIVCKKKVMERKQEEEKQQQLLRQQQAKLQHAEREQAFRAEVRELGLPSVNTCVRYLKLPPYSCKEVLERALLVAITDGNGGFDLS